MKVAIIYSHNNSVHNIVKELPFEISNSQFNVGEDNWVAMSKITAMIPYEEPTQRSEAELMCPFFNERRCKCTVEQSAVCLHKPNKLEQQPSPDGVYKGNTADYGRGYVDGHDAAIKKVQDAERNKQHTIATSDEQAPRMDTVTEYELNSFTQTGKGKTSAEPVAKHYDELFIEFARTNNELLKQLVGITNAMRKVQYKQHDELMAVLQQIRNNIGSSNT